MSAIIDSNLTLVYKNIVGLSNIVTDTLGNAYLQSSLTVNSNFYVSNNTILNNNLISKLNLTITGSSILNNSVSINSSLNISGSLNINSNTTINNSLQISGNTKINNNLLVNNSNVVNNYTSLNSQLYVSGVAYFKNNINVTNINGTTLSIIAPTISIGNSNSNIYINGTATYVASSDTLIVDKLISLNVNSSTLQGADIGLLSGIEIMGISSSGYIMTNTDATRFILKSPLLGAPTNYITIQDSNNNLVISGKTILINCLTSQSLFNVSGSSIFNSSISINSNINISGSTNINGPCIINNSSNISGTTIINNNCSINSLLSINGLININNSTSINSSLNVSGNSIINGNMSINSILSVNGNMNVNNVTNINSSLNINGITNFMAPVSINNNLNITGNSIINSNETIQSNLYLSGTGILNNSTSINSSLMISGKSIINNFVTINSNLYVNGQIINQMPNYDYNSEAKNAGIPIWGWYRSGGLLKIRLNDIPPTIYLTGGTSLTISINDNYTDPGVYALDYFNTYNPVYLSTLLSGNSNLLLSNLLISGTSTLITQTSSLPVGSYTATYQATDSSSNIGYNYRIISINNPPPPIVYYIPSNYLFTWLSSTAPIFTQSGSSYSVFVNRFTAFTLNQTSLSTINFDITYNSSWLFIIKTIRTSSLTDAYFNINFDGPLTNWGANTNYGQEEGRVGSVFTNNNHNDNGAMFTGTFTNIFPSWANGIYIACSYNISNKLFNIIVYDISGNILVNLTSTSPYTYTNKLSPVYFYTNGQTYTINRGMYYNFTTNNVPFSTFSTYF